MQPRWFYAGLATVVCALLAVTLVPSPRQHVAMLERLVPRIERAQSLTPESRDAILALMERVRTTAADARHHERRETVLRRVTDALDAKNPVSSVGHATAD